MGIKFAFIYCKLIAGTDSNELTDLKAEINQDIEAAGADGGEGQDPLVDSPHRVLHQGRDPRGRGVAGAQLSLLQADIVQHWGGLSVPQYVRPRSEDKMKCRLSFKWNLEVDFEGRICLALNHHTWPFLDIHEVLGG